MSNTISEVEGIGPVLGEKLNNAGIKTVEGLLEKGAQPSGRAEIAKNTGIDEKRILKWVNMADLFRINGVGSEYAELLEASGVDTVKELRNRNAENLHAKMEEINASKKLVRQMPSLDRVRDFVKEASTLNPLVTY